MAVYGMGGVPGLLELLGDRLGDGIDNGLGQRCRPGGEQDLELVLEVVRLGADLCPPGLARRLLPGDQHGQDEHQQQPHGQQRGRIQPGGPQQDPTVPDGELRAVVRVVGPEPAADQVDGHHHGRDHAGAQQQPAPPAADHLGLPRRLVPPRGHLVHPAPRTSV
jgi:hypothetical protein